MNFEDFQQTVAVTLPKKLWQFRELPGDAFGAQSDNSLVFFRQGSWSFIFNGCEGIAETLDEAIRDFDCKYSHPKYSNPNHPDWGHN